MKTIRVVAAVIREENRIFATARGYGEYKGWWEFPGGKIEQGETPEAALIREIREELDSEIEVGELIDTIEYDYPDFHLSMQCYLCRLLSGNLTLIEAEDARWLTEDTIDTVKWLPADISIIEKIKAVLGRENETLNYYNENASEFVSGTLNAEFVEVQDKFLSCIPMGASILDFGCGSGRDTRYFLDKGYKVEATDGSAELCRLASEYTGIKIKQMLFSELDEKDRYDGIWACSSILHCSKSELKSVLYKMLQALKDNGIIYTSFKYGDFEGTRNGRYFTDFTIELFEEFIAGINGISVKEYWITNDVRPGRDEEKWLNLFLEK